MIQFLKLAFNAFLYFLYCRKIYQTFLFLFSINKIKSWSSWNLLTFVFEHLNQSTTVPTAVVEIRATFCVGGKERNKFPSKNLGHQTWKHILLSSGPLLWHNMETTKRLFTGKSLCWHVVFIYKISCHLNFSTHYTWTSVSATLFWDCHYNH